MKSDHKALEQIVKGFANHRRIQILMLLESKSGMTLFDIAKKLRIDFRTASEHTKKLVVAGLISKKYRGRIVQHSITKRGKQVLIFCRMLE